MTIPPSTSAELLAEHDAAFVDRVNRPAVAYGDSWTRAFRAGTFCPHCSETVADLAGHVRDTGDLAVCPPGACPVLFAKRNSGGRQ